MDGRRQLAALVACVAALSAMPLAAQSDETARRLVRELVPEVERAVGLTFKRPPVVAVRSRDQLRRYLEHRVRTELPAADLRGGERAYKAFGLVPDSLDLLRLMLDVLEEQVAGFYDPDSGTLFVIRGGDNMLLRPVVAHELVHALQDQYMPLAPLLKMRRSNDRQTAAQAVMEGQATLAMFVALTRGITLDQLADAWPTMRRAVTQAGAAGAAAGQLGRAPRILREALIFPYLHGAEFMLGYERRRVRAGDMPYGERLPVSTEQILHPSRYTGNERPVRLSLRAGAAGDTLIYEDDFGEFEIRIALETWGLGEAEALAAAGGWHGDRYQLLGTRHGVVVHWATAWDTPQDAAEFERALRRGWGQWVQRRSAPARRWTAERSVIAGVTVVRLVDAPEAWAGWRRLPGVSVAR